MSYRDHGSPADARLVTRKLAPVAAVAAALTAVGIVHAVVGFQGPGDTGPLVILDHLFDLVVVLSLLMVCGSVGRFALVRCGVDFDQPIESVVFAVTVGGGIVSTSLLALGALSGLQTVTVGILLLLFAAITRKELAEVVSFTARVPSYLQANGGPRIFFAFAVLVFGSVALFLVVLGLAPPVDWDALMYHLRVPDQFLEQDRVYLPEDNLHVAFVGLAHMLYLPLLAYGSPSAPAAANAILALLLGLAVFSFCARFLEGRTGSLSLAMVWGTTTVLLVAVTPRTDVTLGLYLFLAQYALLLALSSSGRGHFYLAALLLGFAFGIKYHAAPYIVGLVPLVLWVARSRGTKVLDGVRPAMVFGLWLIAAATPWLIKNWILLRAPLSPLFTAMALEPWLIPLFGNANVPASVDPRIFQTLAEVRVQFNLWDAFFAPGRLTIEPEGALYYANPILLLLPLWVFFARDRILTWLVIPAIVYLLIVLVSFPATNLRYLVPAAVPLTIVAIHGVVRFSERVLAPRSARAALTGLAILSLVPSARAMYLWVSRTDAVGHLFGVTSATEYMAGHVDPGVRVYAPLVQFVNNEVPEESRILMLFEARGYYFKPTVLQDNRVTNWPLLASTSVPDACLESTEVTHVLLAIGSLNYYVRRGLDLDVVREAALQQFAQQCLAPVYQTPGYVLFRVRRGSG